MLESLFRVEELVLEGDIAGSTLATPLYEYTPLIVRINKREEESLYRVQWWAI